LGKTVFGEDSPIDGGVYGGKDFWKKVSFEFRVEK